MAEVRWLKGDLVGACVGKPHRKVGGSGLARWYKLELVEAVVSQWQAVPGPPTTAPSGPEPFCQAKLRDVRLKARTPGAPDEELSVQQLSVWDWSIRDQREGGGESRCTLVGTVYAQEVPGTRRPALPDGADRLGRWGCLTLLLAALVAAWLWWSCGPFTCGLWAAVTLTSWWTHRARTRRRTPPALGSKILQGVLAFLLVLGGVGLTVVMYEPANAGACTEVAALYLLAGVGVVVASSLLTISWQLPWTWVLWTAVVALWCGRTGTDCAAVWLERAQREVFPSATRPGAALEDLRRRVTGEPEDVGGSSPGVARPGGGGPGPARPDGSGADATGSGGAGSDGTGPGGTGPGGTGPGGTGPGGTGPGGTGPGGTGPGGTGPGGTGPGGAGPGRTGPGGAGSDGTGSGDTGSGGTGSGGTGSGGTGSGGTGSGGTGSGGTGPGGTGSGGTGSGGMGPGGTGSGGTGSGGTAPGGTGPGGTGPAGAGPRAPAAPSPGALADGEASLAAASEPRMSVEAAQRDPRPFLDGSTRITLDGDLLFAFDEDRLKPEAEPRLRAVAKLLREDPLTRVLLEGHADTIGGDQYNQGLSERRAQAVRAWLVEKAHLSPLQIDTVGYGNGKPLVPASRGPAAQAPNRRVEVLVLPR